MTKSVFISSTSKDLQAHRAVVNAALRRLELRPIDMVDFDAQPGDAVKISLAQVRKADIFIGVIAHRYGYVPEGQEKSVTELEYDEAKKRDIPRLMYLVDPDYTGWPEEHRENTPKLAAFKARIEKENVRGLFTTPEDLAQKVSTSVARLLDEQRRKQRFIALIGGLIAILTLIAVVLLADAGIRSDVIEMAGLATTIPSPTATPMEGVPFAENEVGVVLADFKYIDEDATRVEDNLEREFDNAQINFVRVTHQIDDSEHARQVSDIYNATIVIWGEVARGGVVVSFEVTPRNSRVVTTVEELQISVAELASFDTYLFEGMDSLYIVEFIQGQLLYFEKDYSRAASIFTRAISRIPSGREVSLKAAHIWFYRGTSYSRLNNYLDAIADFDKVIELDPSISTAYVSRGDAHAGLENYEAAMADFERAIGLDPQDAFAYNNRGVVYQQLGNNDNALIDYNHAIEIDPSFSHPYTNRGIIYAELEMYEQALADFSRAIELNPESYDAFNNRGTVYNAVGQYELALEDFSKAIELNPVYGEAYFGRAAVLSSLGRDEAAINDYSQAIDLMPDFPTAYNNRGVVYQKIKDYDSALEDFSKAILLDPLYADAYSNLGVVYSLLGTHDLALTNFNQAIDLNPNHADAYNNRGYEYAVLGEYEEAIADYSTAIELNPDISNAYRNRASAYVNLGHYAHAVIDYSTAIEQGDKTPETYFNRGAAYVELKNYDAALADYTQAIKLDPEFFYAYVNRGIVYLYRLESRNCELGRADWERFVELVPDDPQAGTIRSELDRLCPEN